LRVKTLNAASDGAFAARCATACAQTGTLSDVSARGFYSPNNWVLLILLGVNVRASGRGVRSGLECSALERGERRSNVRRAGSGLGFIGSYDSPRVATIIHLELLFRRWFEAQGDTPVRIGRGCKNGGTVLLYYNPWG